jgi:hypothetical protein
VWLVSAIVLPIAHACSCVEQSVSLAWPRNGEQDVPLGSALTLLDGAVGSLPRILEAEDGSIIALEADRKLSLDSICSPGVLFMRPSEQLQPNTTYRVAMTTEDGSTDGISFTTETSNAVAIEVPAVEVHPYLLTRAAPCVSGRCGSRVELRVTVGAVAQHDLPTWLTISVSGNDDPLALRTQRLNGVPREFYLSMNSTLDAPCITYEVIDASGRVRKQEKVCEAEKCAEYSAEFTESNDGCSTYTSAYGAELWDLIGKGSCAAPPLVEERRGAGHLRYAFADDDGCSVHGNDFCEGRFFAMLILAAALVYMSRPRMR